MAYRAIFVAMSAGVILCPQVARAQNGLQLDLSAGASAERNPFFETGPNTASTALFFQLDPTYRTSDEISSLSLAGTFRVEEYLRRNDTSASARVRLDASRRISPNTTLRGFASARTSRTSALDLFANTLSLNPTPTLATAIPDVTFAAIDTRITQLEAGIGADHEINPREKISVDLSAGSTRFSQSGQANYRVLSANVVYDRKLSEKTWGYISVRALGSDYLGQSADDGFVLTPTAGVRTELSAKLSFEVGLGFSLTRFNRLGGGRITHVVPAVRAKLCQRAATGSLCLTASRETQPTALSGLTTVTNVGAVITRRLNAKDEFSAYLSYTLTGRPSGISALTPGADLFTAAATYSHEFSKRFAGFISPSYTRLSQAGSARRSNPGVRLGLRYQLGNMR